MGRSILAAVLLAATVTSAPAQRGGMGARGGFSGFRGSVNSGRVSGAFPGAMPRGNVVPSRVAVQGRAGHNVIIVSGNPFFFRDGFFFNGRFFFFRHRHHRFFFRNFSCSPFFGSPFFCGSSFGFGGFPLFWGSPLWDDSANQPMTVPTAPPTVEHEQPPPVETPPAAPPVPAPSTPAEPAARSPAAAMPELSTVLVFKDQHRVEVRNYAIVGPTLYAFEPNRTRKIHIAHLDVPATVKLNEDRGVAFRLPSGRNEAVTRP